MLTERNGSVIRITLNRPEKRNALSLPVLRELTEAFVSAGKTDATGVVLAAEGPVVSAGHNFGDMLGADYATTYEVFDTCTRMMKVIQSIPQIVVARVHALATAAGCQLVATCDLAVAADTASFAIPGGKGGLFCHTPLVAVARNLGRKRALELALTGDAIDAQTAYALSIGNGPASRIYRTDDGGEVVVGEHHGGGFLAHLRAGDPDRHTDVGLLQGGGVVDAITGHGHHLAIGLQRLHDPQLLLGRHPGIDAATGHHRPKRWILHRLQLAAQHHLPIGCRQANRRPNRSGRERMVAGDHHRANSRLTAGGHGGCHLRTGWIQLGHQAQQHLALEVELWAGVVGGAGEGEHP